MADRNLITVRDAYEPDNGYRSELRIERSAAGRPGLFFIIDRYHDGKFDDQACVVVEDGAAVLRPVLEWLERA